MLSGALSNTTTSATLLHQPALVTADKYHKRGALYPAQGQTCKKAKSSARLPKYQPRSDSAVPSTFAEPSKEPIKGAVTADGQVPAPTRDVHQTFQPPAGPCCVNLPEPAPHALADPASAPPTYPMPDPLADTSADPPADLSHEPHTCISADPSSKHFAQWLATNYTHAFADELAAVHEGQDLSASQRSLLLRCLKLGYSSFSAHQHTILQMGIAVAQPIALASHVSAWL